MPNSLCDSNLSVSEARGRILSSSREYKLGCELVALSQALGRVLGEDEFADLTSPSFSCSAMDGYAVRCGDFGDGDEELLVIGESAAGAAETPPPIEKGQCVRIFTGAALPLGADGVIIQEKIERLGDVIRLRSGEDKPQRGEYVREAGLDFRVGDRLCGVGDVLTVRRLALLANGGKLWLRVRRKPKVLILSGGSELVLPGGWRKAGDVVASNALTLQNMAEMWGAEAHILPLAADDKEALRGMLIELTTADVIVSSGGASVGDYDLIRPAFEDKSLGDLGLKLEFYKIRMRPGKPMMFGRLAGKLYLGLPGNPVSVMVCGCVFLRPLLLGLAGAISEAESDNVTLAHLAESLPAEGQRQHYLRAEFSRDTDGTLWVSAVREQDSSVLSATATADGFIIRPPKDPARQKGAKVNVMRFPQALKRF